MLVFSSYDQLTNVVCVSEVGLFVDLNIVVIMATRRLMPAGQIVNRHGEGDHCSRRSKSG
jgi:hypothetical protein